MDKETKNLIIKIASLCAISGLAIMLLGDAGLIITFLAIVLYGKK